MQLISKVAVKRSIFARAAFCGLSEYEYTPKLNTGKING
jgi:hypothetical protein